MPQAGRERFAREPEGGGSIEFSPSALTQQVPKAAQPMSRKTHCQFASFIHSIGTLLDGTNYYSVAAPTLREEPPCSNMQSKHGQFQKRSSYELLELLRMGSSH